MHQIKTKWLLLALLLAVVFIGSLSKASDGDLFRRVKTGELALSGSVPAVDVFSHTFEGKPWYHFETVSDIFLALFNRLGGPDAISIACAAFASLLFLFLFLNSVKRGGSNTYVAFLTCLFSFFVCRFKTLRFSEIFSLLIMAVFVSMIERYGEKKKQMFLYALVPLQIFWASVDQSALLGLLIFLIFMISGILPNEIETESPAKGNPKGSSIEYLVAILLVAAVFVNPMGYRIFDMQMGDTHASLFKTDTYILILVSLMVLVFSASLYFKFRLFDFSLFFTGLALTAFSLRFIPVFAVIASPIIADSVNTLVSNFKVFRKKHLSLSVAVAAILLIAVPLFSKDDLKPSRGIEKKAFPDQAASFLLENEIKGNLFNPYNWGGYLIYRLYPYNKVFIDERVGAFYNDKFFGIYLAASSDAKAWERVSERFKFNIVIYPYDNKMSVSFPGYGDKGFKPVYWDEGTAILLRDVPANTEVIKKYGFKRLDLSNPLKQIMDYKKSKRVLRDIEQDLLKSLNFNDSNIYANYLLAVLYGVQNKKEAETYVERVRNISAQRGIPPVL